MKIGTSVIERVEVYSIQIEDEEGGSYVKYFETEDNALLRSILDGCEKKPKIEVVLKLSDGHYIHEPRYIAISKAPDKKEIDDFISKRLPPALISFIKKNK